MAATPTPLKVKDNASILDAIRHDASLEYQNRIPSADQAGLQETIRNLTSPTNRPLFNEFLDTLVNRIGLVISRNNNWTNPLAPFKRGMLEYGSHIEEIQVGLLKAHSYDPDREYMERTLFGTELPDVQTNFHTVNRQDFYKVSVNNQLLKRAFLESDGLYTFANQLMEAPSTSDQWDEFLQTCELFSVYEKNGGFYHVHVPDVVKNGSTAEDSKAALRKMRAAAGNLQFLSTKYNAAHMPISARPDELIILASPEFQAAVDVEALSAAFNIERSEMYGRMVTIPQDRFGIDGCQAILTTKDFFVIADQTFETASQWNPAALQNNYFLHHWQVISASRFVPAIMFTTGQDDEAIYVSKPPTKINTLSITNADGDTVTEATRGQLVQLDARNAAGEVSDGDNTGIIWTVTGQNDPRTYITATGVLHVSGEESATSVTVKAETTFIDADKPTGDPVTATKTVKITGDTLTAWPDKHEHKTTPPPVDPAAGTTP